MFNAVESDAGKSCSESPTPATDVSLESVSSLRVASDHCKRPFQQRSVQIRKTARIPMGIRAVSRSESLGNHELDEVANAVAVAPFVVVPIHQLEELAVEFDTAPLVEDRRGFAVNEVAAHDFVFGVFKDPLKIRFAGLLHRCCDFRVAGFLDGFDRQIDNRNRWCRNAERHPGNLPLHFGANQSDGLRCTRGAGDDVLSGGTATLPVFLAWTVDRLLGRGISVDGGHQTFVDAKTFFEKNVDDWREAVGCTRSVRDDVVRLGIVLVAVHAHHDRDIFTLGGSRDDHLFGTSRDMSLGLFGFGEQAR